MEYLAKQHNSSPKTILLQIDTVPLEINEPKQIANRYLRIRNKKTDGNTFLLMSVAYTYHNYYCFQTTKKSPMSHIKYEKSPNPLA